MRLLRQPILLILLLIISIAVGGYGYFQHQQTQRDLKSLRENPRVVAIEEIKRLVAKLGAVVDLPKGEEPVVATITDIKKLKDQPFFAKAQNGDKVLIYTQAKRAILYRPSTSKVIDVAPINIGQSQQSAKVAVYNGTTTVGATNTIVKEVEAKINNIGVVVRENAARNNYAKSLVIDLSGNRPDLTSQLANLLKAEIGSLPEGETKPNADILVIIGSNYK